MSSLTSSCSSSRIMNRCIRLVSLVLFGIGPAASFVPGNVFDARSPLSCSLPRAELRSHHPSSSSGDSSRERPPSPHGNPDEFLVKVQFDDFGGETETVAVRRGESLLSALERAASAQGWSEVPSDCRRGNCLTCTARHSDTSQKENVKPLTEDGLSPALSLNSDDDDDDKFFLTCRSTVTGPGVELQLGQNSVVWKHIYQTRFEDESTRRITNKALARVLRKAAESDPDAWREQTEALWQQQQREGRDNDDGLLPPEQQSS